MPLADLTPIVAAKALDLSIECRLLADKYTGTLQRWTTATKDYDGFGTTEIQTVGRYRQVSIEGPNYNWQVGRYQSGFNTVLTQEQFDREQVELAV